MLNSWRSACLCVPVAFFLLFPLASCTQHIAKTAKDGPPPFKVDLSHVPDAVPKHEPLSRYGNKNYRVRGRYYRVERHRKASYVATGTASWYGTKFHGHRTSSGEPYNMLAMTAAHRTLPLPTYARVTNLHNGRSVIVKINDRGPFEHNRLIDLSYAAAHKLGVHARGTAKVRLEVVQPSAPAPERPSFASDALAPSPELSPSSVEMGQRLRLASFRDRLRAQKLQGELLKNFKESRARIQVIHRGRQKIYRVEAFCYNNCEKIRARALL